MSDDLVARLRSEGENALRKHTSLGMWGLCAEAAARIEGLESAIDKAINLLSDDNVDPADALVLLMRASVSRDM